MAIQKVEIGDCREVIRKYPDNFFDCLVTSPPYYKMRNYNTPPLIYGGNPNCNHQWIEKIQKSEDGPATDATTVGANKENEANNRGGEGIKYWICPCGAFKGEIGWEPTPEMFIRDLIEVFETIRPKIKETGSIWVNLGDKWIDLDQQLIPEQFALGMKKKGWILINKITWIKLNSMPESVKRRLSKTSELIFHFVKSRNYWYDLDAIREPHKTQSLEMYQRAINLGSSAVNTKYGDDRSFMGVPKHPPKWFTGANTGVNNKAPYKDNNPHRTRLYEGKFTGMGEGSEQYGSPRARNERQSNSKFLKSNQITASPGARAILSERDGKLTTFVRTELHECGQHLKDKLKHSNYTLEQLSNIIGIKETTLSHYFRTDLSGQAIPDRDTWEALQELIGIGNYEDYILEEIKDALPNPHPFGKNPGDTWEISTQSYSGAHFACVDESTEILTIDGWKKYTEIKPFGTLPFHIKIATYNLDRHIIEYQILSNIREYDYDGDLINIESRDLDILMTPNHRNVVIRGDKEEIVNADEIKKYDKIKVCAPVEYKSMYSVGKIWAELIGWVIAEGSYLYIDKDYRCINIYQNEGINEKRIDQLLNNANILYSKYNRIRNYNGQIKHQIYWNITKCPFVDWMFQYCPNKTINKLLSSLPIDELVILFNSLVSGDGHIRKDDGRILFTQKNIESVKWFEIIAMRCGYHTLTTLRSDVGIYNIFCTKKESIGIRGTNGNGLNINRVYYKGKVWCPTVKNGTWIAKRNGHIFITGNSFPVSLVRIPILATCPIYICKKCGKPRERIMEAITIDRTATDGKGNGELADGSFGSSIQRQSGWSDCQCGAGYDAGWVLDPFAGSGTTLEFCRKENRNAVGIELNPDYKPLIVKRAKLNESQVKSIRRTEIL